MKEIKAEEVEGEEEELVDPQEKLRESCTDTKCQEFKLKLEECNDRVNSRTKTSETCFEEVVDFMHCVDHCASKKLFNFLK